jgi:hypothetical protein
MQKIFEEETLQDEDYHGFVFYTFLQLPQTIKLQEV